MSTNIHIKKFWRQSCLSSFWWETCFRNKMVVLSFKSFLLLLVIFQVEVGAYQQFHINQYQYQYQQFCNTKMSPACVYCKSKCIFKEEDKSQTRCNEGWVHRWRGRGYHLDKKSQVQLKLSLVLLIVIYVILFVIVLLCWMSQWWRPSSARQSSHLQEMARFK